MDRKPSKHFSTNKQGEVLSSPKNTIIAQLKISELSVGDWVMFTIGKGFLISPPIFESNPAQVVALHRGAEMSVLVDGHREFMAIPLSACSPIPITPEILEKNGFVKNGAYNEWNIGEWNESPFIGVSLDRQAVRVKHFGNDIFIENKVVYVHQLQHALRLAGVEKEIEL